MKRAVGDEVEFDFDSNTERGATRIPANFIRARAGAEVIGQLLNANGVVVGEPRSGVQLQEVGGKKRGIQPGCS